MWLFASLYLIGLALGVAANFLFDVQLRRPGLRQLIVLVSFFILLWTVISVTQTPFTDIVLPVVWIATGVLAGVGSQTLAYGSGTRRVRGS